MKFSISVPIGAYHPFLPWCLESLAKQGDLVEICLLDASDDPRVSAVADHYNAALTYRRHGPDGGQSDAIKEGWDHSSAPFLGWLNADDILFPDTLEKVSEKLASNPALDVVYGHSTILDEQARMTGYHWAVEPPGPRLLEGGIISQPSCFFRRASYESAGGIDLSLHYTMDWDLFIRIYKSGAKFDFIDAPLSMVLWGDETKTASFNARRREELQRIIKKYAPEEKQSRIFRSFAIQNLLSRIRPDSLQDAITRLLTRGRKVVYGLAADGTIADRADLSLVHYDPEPKEKILVAFNDVAQLADIEIPGRTFTQEISGNIATLTMDAPVSSADAFSVRVSAKAGKPLRFRYCQWA